MDDFSKFGRNYGCFSAIKSYQYQSLFSVKYRYVNTETSLALVSSLVIGDFWNVYRLTSTAQNY